MLNTCFATPGWRPDPAATYRCSKTSDATSFTYLMALVLSGRDTTNPHLLARQAELDALLATPESSIACRQVNSIGWTALMMAARNSATDSTEATVVQLLAHESGGEVARMQNKDGSTALMLAACNLNYDSTEETVARFLQHESGDEVARIQDKEGYTVLMMAVGHSFTDKTEAIVAQLLAHESAKDLMQCKTLKGETTLEIAAKYASEDVLAMVCEHSESESFKEVSLVHTKAFHAYLCQLHARTRERATMAHALQQGLSLPASLVLTYI
jgi:ankyrin repeat protein